ncbi:hypothetical protein ACJVC5_19820 [Peredibacter sp. HCB2-198]|uniref:hypothetical protein n=1 Tax=Peredibacter sp. HCB2-198 TaxID=3383025 RepID=UPI0038B6079A
MKFSLFAVMMIISMHTFAESKCDVRPGTSVGIRVIEFVSKNVIHSKIPLKEATASALEEEMLNLQDMGVCEERIYAQRCVLKFEKQKNQNFITMIRGTDRWKTWNLSGKNEAQEFVKSLKKVGFCS